MSGKTDLHNEIFSLCDSGETGTFYITTTDNRGCYVVINSGEVIALSFGRDGGDSFIKDFINLKIKSFSFKQGLILPMSAKAKISSSLTFLNKLGYQMYASNKLAEFDLDLIDEIEAELDIPFPEDERKSRGKVIQEAIPERIRQEIEFEAARKEKQKSALADVRPLAGL